jgi:UDPglucose--hexose-1-phosphate uridylyltransferase
MRSSPDRPTASELRRDPILRRWVVVAPQRTSDLVSRRAETVDPVPAAACPFCPGAETANPVEIARAADGDAWTIRVTPDRHPLLRIEGGLDQRAVGMFDCMNAVGAHELVIDTADHALSWADFAPAHMVRLLAIYRERLRDLRRDVRFHYAIVLMNRGAAWSRYSHAHSHVIATPFAPKRIEEELLGAELYHRRKERCAFCDQLSEEVDARTRIVAERPGFVALAPYASQHPYETWVLPSLHEADFGAISDDGLVELAGMLVDLAGRLRRVLDDPPYSVALHAGPLDGSHRADYHWHWEIVPLIGQELGMEWASGIVSNAVPPEAAADALRYADPRYISGRDRT